MSPAFGRVISIRAKLASSAYQLSVISLVIGFFLVCMVFVSPVHAQTPPNTQDLLNSGLQNVGNAITSQNYKAPQNGQYAVMNLLHSVLCEVGGTSPGGACLGNVSDGKTVKVFAYKQVPGGGAIGVIGGVLASLYQPPTSSVEYVADIGERVGIVRTAHAQVSGSGANLIKPIKALWQFTQKIAYIAFIIVFLVVGFMVMFRRRINPQTVVSIQSALPGLVIGLIMVTFSYFISALIIDVSFVSVQIVAQIFSQQPNAFGKTSFDHPNQSDNQKNLQNLANRSNVFDFLGYTVERYSTNANDAKNALDHFIDSTNPSVRVITGVLGLLVGLIIFIAAPGLGILAGTAAGGAGGLNISTVVGYLIPAILIIALTVQIFRLLFALINTYIQLLVAAIFGPFYILASSIPGQGKRLTDWMKTLLANALVFPAVFVVFLFAGAILATNPDSWKSPPPFFGGLPTDIIRLLVAYGAILAVPSIPDAVRAALGIKGQDNIGKAAVAGFLGGFATAQGGTVGGYQRLWRGGAQRGEVAGGILAEAYTTARNRGLGILPPLRGRTPRITADT